MGCSYGAMPLANYGLFIRSNATRQLWAVQMPLSVMRCSYRATPFVGYGLFIRSNAAVGYGLFIRSNAARQLWPVHTEQYRCRLWAVHIEQCRSSGMGCSFEQCREKRKCRQATLSYGMPHALPNPFIWAVILLYAV